MLINFIEEPFLYNLPCLIRYDSSFLVFFRYMISIFTIISLFLIPLNLGFEFMPLDELETLEYFIEIILLSDLLITLVAEVQISSS